MADREKLRAELRQILDKPIFPREGIDPIEAVTDYLIDKNVLPVVRCKDCIYFSEDSFNDYSNCDQRQDAAKMSRNDFCSWGERKEEKKND